MTTPTTVQVQIQLRADTAANWTSEDPTLLANEVGLETDTKKLKVGDGTTAWTSLAYFPSIVTGGTVLGNLEIGTTGTLTFEGSTADGFETTLAVTDPTADRTITLPDQSGTVVVTGNASIVDADIAADAEIVVSKLADGAARQLLQTDAAGTGVEWTDNVDVPGTLDVTGAATFDDDVTIDGDLTVNGTTTTIDTETLLVKDKNIELAVVDTPTDLTADGGGITLKGATDKTISWSDTTDAWTSNQVVDLPAGSAATPSLIFGADVNTGIYSPGADQVAISTNGTGRLFVDSSGRVLVGTSGAPPAIETLTPGLVRSGSGTAQDDYSVGIYCYRNSGGSGRQTVAPRLYFARSRSGTNNSTGGVVINNEDIGNIRFAADDGTNFITAAEVLAEVDGTPGANDMPGRLVFSTTSDGASSPTEAMRIDSNQIIYGKGSASLTYYANTGTSVRLYTGATNATGSVAIESTSLSTSTRHHFSFSNPNGVIGSIATSASATAYNTSSDYRLKENVVPLTGAADRVNQLQVHRFNFIADPDTTVDGFIAHEAQAVVPECVTGTKDEVDADGNPVYQGIDQSKLVPLLTAALQEALAEIESLKARLTAAGI